MYLFLIYNNPEQTHLCFWGKFSRIKDVIEYTDGLFRYSDVSHSGSIYRTYKCFFRLIKVSPLERWKYFRRKNWIQAPL